MATSENSKMGDLANYAMGIGKCRMKDKSKTDGWEIVQQNSKNNVACALECDMDPACTAFHFYKVNFVEPRGSCVTWTDLGLYPNGESTSDCYLKKSMNPGTSQDKNLLQLTGTILAKKTTYPKNTTINKKKDPLNDYYLPTINNLNTMKDTLKDYEIPHIDDALDQLSSWMNSQTNYKTYSYNYYYG